MEVNSRLPNLKDHLPLISRARVKGRFLLLQHLKSIKQHILQEHRLFSSIHQQARQDGDNNNMELRQARQCQVLIPLDFLKAMPINHLNLHLMLVNKHSSQLA